VSSLYLLAYASVAMTEVPGAAAQLVVLYCYLRYRRVDWPALRNELSPGLFRWALGPPSGVARLPLEGELGRATHVLLIVPVDAATSPDIAERYPAHRGGVEAMVARGELTLAREWTIADLHVALQLFRRP
jgi:hypothetical protein